MCCDNSALPCIFSPFFLESMTGSAISRNSSFDEYRESDWKETSRTPKYDFNNISKSVNIIL